MQLSSTAKTLLKNKNGWRNDALFDNKNRPFVVTLKYEIEVLGNLDILYFVFNHYFNDEYKKNKDSFYSALFQEYIDNDMDFDVLFKEYDLRSICNWINSYFCERLNVKKSCDLYCKWLTTIEGYNRIYGNEMIHGYELKNYVFPNNSMIASDLGLDGSLIVADKPFICNKKRFIE